MIGPFTADFIGGLCLGLATALTASITTFVWMLYRTEDDSPERGNPFVESIEPDPVPGIMASLDQEWKDVNR